MKKYIAISIGMMMLLGLSGCGEVDPDIAKKAQSQDPLLQENLGVAVDAMADLDAMGIK